MPNIPAALGLEVPNLLPESVLGLHLDWMRPAGRLIWSSLIAIVATIIIVVWAKRPKDPAPATWAASMLGAVAVFGLMMIGYGVIPHEWLTYANSYLDWGTDSFLLHKNSVLPFDITMRAVKDSIAALIYVVVATVNVWLFVLWQKRPVKEPAAEEASAERTETRTSAYGRPVTAGS